ncbi:MAG: DNA topoisomerase IV subunit A [Candidatus Jordarchaeales archaeon]
MVEAATILSALSRSWSKVDSVAKKVGASADVVLKMLEELAAEGLVESTVKDGVTFWRLTAAEARRRKMIEREKEEYEKEVELRNKIEENLTLIGKRLYEELLKGEFPSIEIPSRSTSNIVFDEELGQYVLGDKKILRTAKSLGQIRSFSQLIWVMRFVKELIRMGKSSTLRDVYYSSEAFGIKFKDQQESDTCITEVEAVMRIPREDFRIFPEERSAVYGDLVVEYTTPSKYAGKRVTMNENPDGVMIGPHLVNAKFIRTSADKVIAIECGGMFTRFVEEEVHEKFNAILIHTAGQAPRSTRRFIRRLHYELGLPVYIFTDGDPWGAHIAMVIISGSAAAAHLVGLATPSAIWMGVWASDIERYNLPTDKLTEIDIKRCKELLRDPRYQTPFWQKELKKFLELNKKAEQQSFSRYGLTYVVDEYLPQKFKEIDEMKKRGLL